MPSREDVLSALAKIPGPDGRTPLSESGALTGVSFRDAKVFAAIAIDPADAKKLEPMRVQAEAAIKAIPGVEGTDRHADRRKRARPWRAARPSAPQAARAGTTCAPAPPLPGVKHIVAVASGKGGVGKSTVACNLAVGLGKLGLKVGLTRTCRPLFGPSAQPKLFGVQQKPGVAAEGQKLEPLVSNGVKLMSIGFLIEEAAPVIWRGPMVMSALNQLLREVNWGELDVLIVDMPPGTGDTQLTMAQNVPLAGSVIVSTPQDLALIDARRGIAMFNQTKVPILGIVENMSYFVCPHCGGRSDIFSHAGDRKEAEAMKVPFLGEILLDIVEIRAHSDDGRPVVASMPDTPQAAALRMAIARKVAEGLQINAAAAKPPPRIRFFS